MKGAIIENSTGEHRPVWRKDFLGTQRWSEITSRELVRRLDGDPELHLDSNEGFLFQEDLDHILTRVFNKKYPLLEARSKLFLDNIPLGKNQVKYRGYDGSTMAQMRAPGSTEVPYVDVSGAELTAPVRTNWIGAKYDLEELEAAAQSEGEPLDAALMNACRRGCETRYDLQLRFGDPGTGTTGLLNNASVATTAITNGDWLNAATTDQMIADDIEEVINAIDSGSNSVHQATRFDFDSTSWRRVTRSIVGTDGGTSSILKMVQANHPEITFERWNALTTASGADPHTGLGGAPMLFVWEDSEEVVWGGVAREASPEPPQQFIASFIIFWLQRVIPGAVFTFPGAARYVTAHIV